jgi:DNA-binding beta-propeller fold protein YncE
MPNLRSVLGVALAVAIFGLIALPGGKAFTQADPAPINDLPNPYRTVKDWAQFPDGRAGAVAAVTVDSDGKHIWVLERCGENSCAVRETGEMKDVDPVLLFDENGKLVRSFGAGMFVGPHRIYVDPDGNVWVTDYSDNGPRRPRPQLAPGQRRPPMTPNPDAKVGHQVIKFSPEGKVLMTLGIKGGALAPDYFLQPCDVLVAPNGEFFVSLGHGWAKPEVLKFTAEGKLIKRWGKLGTGPGEFDQAHSLGMDSKGRLFVGDRNNNRIQIFDQDGNYLDEIKQFSRPSGFFIDKDDTLYVADSESESVSRNHNDWKRGIRIGSLKDGVVKYFIPDPEKRTRDGDDFTSTSSAEGITVDAAGNIYGAEVGDRALKKYVLK